MKRVYSSLDRFMVGQLRNALESRGIACLVKNEFLGGAAGELPPTECWPEIWVLEDGDLDAAKRVVSGELAAREAPAAPWRCLRCGQELEGQFGVCWHCGALRETP
jgi:hypothetical protein